MNKEFIVVKKDPFEHLKNQKESLKICYEISQMLSLKKFRSGSIILSLSSQVISEGIFHQCERANFKGFDGQLTYLKSK